MNLQFHFVSDEIARERRPLTRSEINELRTLAHTIEGIIEVMTVYTQDDSGDDQEGKACCAAVFKALTWLMEPLNRYLFEYAGEAAAPDPVWEETETAALGQR